MCLEEIVILLSRPVAMHEYLIKGRSMNTTVTLCQYTPRELSFIFFDVLFHKKPSLPSRILSRMLKQCCAPNL